MVAIGDVLPDLLSQYKRAIMDEYRNYTTLDETWLRSGGSNNPNSPESQSLRRLIYRFHPNQNHSKRSITTETKSDYDRIPLQHRIQQIS
jgi:hypothetical protein